MTVKGADAVLKALEQEGVEVIFGIPGGASMPIYDPLVDRSPIRHVLCRHEQGAGHAAEGYAWATGKVGVCMATSGPGATNLVTPLADAKMDSVPIVAITGQVPTPVVGNDAFQEADITGITMPVTKHNFLVKDVGGHRRDDPRGLPHRPVGASRSGARRPAQGRAQRGHRLRVARDDQPARLQADDEGQQPAGQRGREADPGRRAAGAVRGRRRDQGQRVRGADAAGHDRQAAGRHDADGARRVPRFPRAVSGHARHARQLHGGDRDAALRPAGGAWRAVRRPRHGQAGGLRARRQDRARRRRPGRDRQEPVRRRADRR